MVRNTEWHHSLNIHLLKLLLLLYSPRYDYDIKNGLYPRPRTAHAATVVGDELIIHGGMGWDEHTNVSGRQLELVILPNIVNAQ